MKKSNAKEKICGLASYAVLTVLTVAACWFFAGRYGVFGANMDWISQHSVFPEYFRQQFYKTGQFFPEYAANIGGGQNTRMLHPWIGVVLFVSFFILFAQLWRANLPNRVDVQRVSQIGDVVAGHEEKLPEIGKYNAGQKYIFWGMAFFIMALTPQSSCCERCTTAKVASR